MASTGLLGAGDIRSLAEQFGVSPTKRLGQNFVIDANTVRRIARLASISPGDTVLEIGPGLGSLTLALLETGATVTAVEIDPVLAAALPGTVRSRLPDAAPRLTVMSADALTLDRVPGADPTAVVANLPYNVAVPILLRTLQRLPLIDRGLVMVQAEVADRIAAGPGSRTYGVPSVKVAWYAQAQGAGRVPRSVFWPVPNVDSALVMLQRRPPPRTTASRDEVFAVVDAAFGQRRKMVRVSLARLAGSTAAAEQALVEAGVDPTRRAEDLDVQAFAAVAGALTSR